MRRLQQVRRAKGMSLASLAQASGVSPSHISRIESGKRQPSLALSYELAKALGAPLANLLSDGQAAAEQEGILIPADSGYINEDDLKYRPISAAVHMENLQVLDVHVSRDRKVGTLHSHKGIEWIYVCSGAVRVTFESGQGVDLTSGDSYSFHAPVPHRMSTLDGEARVILLVYEAEGNKIIHRPH